MSDENGKNMSEIQKMWKVLDNLSLCSDHSCFAFVYTDGDDERFASLANDKTSGSRKKKRRHRLALNKTKEKYVWRKEFSICQKLLIFGNRAQNYHILVL